MSPSRCTLCFQPSITFSQDFQAVLSSFIQVLNKLVQCTRRCDTGSFGCSQVTDVLLCRSCWTYFMRIHKLDARWSVIKETCDVESKLLSLKIQRDQSSLETTENNWTACEDFDVQILATGSTGFQVGGQNHDSNTAIVGRSSCNESETESVDKSATAESASSDSSTEEEPSEEPESDDKSDFEPQAVEKNAQLVTIYENKWLPNNFTLPKSSPVVKRLSEADFIYLDKYQFQGNEAGFKCGVCPALCTFSTQPPLWRSVLSHIKKWHKGEPRARARKVLQKVTKVAPNRFRYGKYLIEKTDDGKYQCGECGILKTEPARKSKMTYILRHIKDKHEILSSKYVCEYCGAALGTRQSLRDHKMAKHESSGDRFPCTDCDKVFFSRSRAVAHHKNVHQRLYKRHKLCELCGKEFGSKVTLEDHVAYVHNGQKMECKDCGKMFASQLALHWENP